ncbi:MAG: pentapeptide repeat-containing protein [Alphaproteobacteria bacterium]|nr:pentapeptide repeat-containing protein [Alphaproteobacteria bacterium]
MLLDILVPRGPGPVGGPNHFFDLAVFFRYETEDEGEANMDQREDSTGVCRLGGLPRTPQAQLADLLCDLIDSKGLRRELLRVVNGEHVVRDLPDEVVGSAEYMARAVEVLGQHGWIESGDIFTLLRSVRPKRLDDIARVAALWGEEPTEAVAKETERVVLSLDLPYDTLEPLELAHLLWMLQHMAGTRSMRLLVVERGSVRLIIEGRPVEVRRLLYFAERHSELYGIIPEVGAKRQMLAKEPNVASVIATRQRWRDFRKGNHEQAVFFELDLSGTTFAGTNLTNATFSTILLQDVDFRETNLRKAIFRDADLAGADFRRADLRDVEFVAVDLRRANLMGTVLSQATFSQVVLSEVILDMADLAKVNLAGADLSAARLARAMLIEADLTGVDLRHAALPHADLRHAILKKANLGDANLERTDLRGANLTGANLGDASLEHADLRGALLRDADLSNAKLVGTLWDDNTNWPIAHEKLEAAYRIGPKADLHGAYLQDRNLFGVDLRDADLGQASVSQVNLQRANLGGANLSGAKFSHVDLRGAGLVGADLRDASISDTDFWGANLSCGNLSRVSLRSANFSGANLSGADLSTANLEHTNFSGADLSHASLRDADLYGVDLSGANLSGADLSGAELSRTCLGGAELSNVDLRGANLSNADLFGTRQWDYSPYPSLLRTRNTRNGYYAHHTTNSTLFSGVVWDQNTRWPRGFVPPSSAHPRGDDGDGRS